MSSKTKESAKDDRFPTSQEVLQRLRWDPRLRLEDFVVSYEERFKGRRDMRANEFPQNGEIPWHRVWQLRLGRMVIWDRERREHRLEQLHQLQESYQARHPQPASPASAAPQPTPLQSHPSYRYDASNEAGWCQVDDSTPRPLSGALRVCTYNVLFDLYDRDLIHTPQRLPTLHHILEESDADIIGLQEITDEGLAALLAHPWVRRDYFVSALPGSDAIAPYGQVLLSRYPIAQVLTLAHSPHKRTLLVILATTPTPVGIAVIHLTSNRRKDARERRRQQLSDICDLMDGADQAEGPAAMALPSGLPWLLMGDFNTREADANAYLGEHDFADLWPWLYPNKPGDTFVPAENPLAALSSQSQQPGRLDRIFLRDVPGLMLTPTHAQLLGTESIEDVEPLGALHPSDHFGLLCSLQVTSDTSHF